jgi:serine/threonine protein kinase
MCVARVLHYFDRGFAHALGKPSRLLNRRKSKARMVADTVRHRGATMSVTTTALHDDDPKKLPGYDILDVLARDGIGVYYRARQHSLDRIVTLYTIDSATNAESQRCIEREGEVLASLRHPHLVQIHDRVQHEGRVYLALEAVDGGSLDQRIRGRGQPWRASAGLVERLARTLAYVHEHGFLHCDLKPRRIQLAVPPSTETVSDPDAAGCEEFFGIPKVAGFELALRRDDVTELPEGSVRGTPAYLAPEQAQARWADVGPATDIHGLGAILYELLTGRPPFLGESALDSLKLAIESVPPPPRQFNRHIDRKLEAICLKCLHKDPARRYSGGLKLASELRKCIDRRPNWRWFW